MRTTIWEYLRVTASGDDENEYARFDPERRIVEYFGPKGGAWIRGHPRAAEIVAQHLGEEVAFWEYFRVWKDIYVRTNYDLMIAERSDERVGAWIRDDDLAMPIHFKGDGEPITEAEALVEVRQS